MSSRSRVSSHTRARAFVLALASPVLVLTLGSSGFACKADEAEPVAVARAFAEAARRGDVDAMLAVIERPAVDQLALAAERASDQVGGRRSIEPGEMLQIVGVDRTIAVASAELLDDDGERAHVELTMTDGRTIRLELVWEQAIAGDDDSPARAGGWKVRIPMPNGATSDADDPLLPPAQPDA
jgi:hypothetical protein